VRLIAVGCEDIRFSKSGKLGQQQAGCSLRARLVLLLLLLLLPPLLLLADPSQVARYLLWRDVAAGASNTPLMSRAAMVPPLPDRHEPTALHPHLKEKKDLHKGTERNKQSWPI
jgi:hypothetical protein